MIFTYSKHKMLVKSLPIILALFVCIFYKSLYSFVVLFMAIVWFVKYYPCHYKLFDNTITIKRFNAESTISIHTLDHIRRAASNQNQNSDQFATYLISNGEEYIVLDPYPINSKNESIIDILINKYKLPVVHEKAHFWVKTRID